MADERKRHCLGIANNRADRSEVDAIALTKDGSIVGRLQGDANAPPFAFGAGRVLLRRESSDGVITLRLQKIDGLQTNGQGL